MRNLFSKERLIKVQNDFGEVGGAVALQLFSAGTNFISIYEWLDFNTVGLTAVFVLLFAVEFSTQHVVRELVKMQRRIWVAFIGALVVTGGIGLACTLIGYVQTIHSQSVAIALAASTALTSLGSLWQLTATAVNAGMEERHQRYMQKVEDEKRVTQLRMESEQLKLELAKAQQQIDLNRMKEEAAIVERAKRLDIQARKVEVEVELHRNSGGGNSATSVIEPEYATEVTEVMRGHLVDVYGKIEGDFKAGDLIQLTGLGNSATYEVLKVGLKTGVFCKVKHGVYTLNGVDPKQLNVAS